MLSKEAFIFFKFPLPSGTLGLLQPSTDVQIPPNSSKLFTTPGSPLPLPPPLAGVFLCLHAQSDPGDFPAEITWGRHSKHRGTQLPSCSS